MRRGNGWKNFSDTDHSSEVVHYLSSFAEVLNAGQSSVDALKGWVIRDVEIFKAGTYRDVKYTSDDIADIVANFSALKDAGKLDPVFKVNHSEDARDQVGWILSVRQDGDLLLADIHVTEWEAYEKITNGTWKKVSAEIYFPKAAEKDFGINAFVLRAVAVVSVPQVKDIKGIVLNSERWEDPKPKGQEKTKKGGNKPMEWLEKLAAMLGKTVEELTEQDKAGAVAMFGEYQTEVTPGGTGGADGGSAAGMIAITAKDFVTLSESFSKLDATNKDLAAQVANLTKDTKKISLEKTIGKFTEDGKILPAERDSIMKLAEKLEGETLDAYLKTLEDRPKIVQFGETGEQTTNDDDTETDGKMATYNETFAQKTY